MTLSLDPKELTLRDVLDLAILVEEEAEERYTELTEQMEQHHTTPAAELFRGMIANERKHGEELRKRRQERFGETPRRVTRSMLYDVEAPEYESVRAFMTPREALGVALAAEKKAEAFFGGLLAVVGDDGIRGLLSDLQKEEKEHVEMVEAELAKLPPDSDVRPEEIADEPIGL